MEEEIKIPQENQDYENPYPTYFEMTYESNRKKSLLLLEGVKQ